MRHRILLLAKGLGRGGAESIVASCAMIGRESLGFEYRVAYLLPEKDAYARRLREVGVEVTCLRCTSAPGAIRAVSELVRRDRIALVHAHAPIPAVIARAALIGRRLPLVYTEHNVWFRYHSMTRLANACTFSRNSHVFAVSDEVKRSIISSYSRATPPIETLYHGFDPKMLSEVNCEAEVHRGHELNEPPLVVTVANFKPYKGQEHLIRSIPAVLEQVPDARFVLVGVGPREAEMRALADRLRLREHLIFTGYREDAVRMMHSADVFVLPSEQEGLPIALLEAMGVGTPVVATAVGGVPEVVTDGEDGILVPAADPAALSAAVTQLLKDGQARRRLGEAARRRAGHFDIRNAVARIEQVYEGLLA